MPDVCESGYTCNDIKLTTFNLDPRLVLIKALKYEGSKL